MQVYRELNIVNDKPTQEMRDQVLHHVVDVVSVEEEFNVVQFRALAQQAIQDVHARGNVPFVVGGSGMYMSVLLDGIFEARKDEAVRVRLEQQAKEQGLHVLYQRLQQVDPQATEYIHANDERRIVRALEVFEIEGEPISKLQQQRSGLWGNYPIQIFGLQRDRQEVYRRVEERVDQMFDQGVVEEIKQVSTLNLTKGVKRMIGVAEILAHLEGGYDLERANYLMKLNTRHFVKRQLTWFRKEERMEWVDMSVGNKVVIDQLLRTIHV